MGVGEGRAHKGRPPPLPPRGRAPPRAPQRLRPPARSASPPAGLLARRGGAGAARGGAAAGLAGWPAGEGRKEAPGRPRGRRAGGEPGAGARGGVERAAEGLLRPRPLPGARPGEGGCPPSSSSRGRSPRPARDARDPACGGAWLRWKGESEPRGGARNGVRPPSLRGLCVLARALGGWSTPPGRKGRSDRAAQSLVPMVCGTPCHWKWGCLPRLKGMGRTDVGELHPRRLWGAGSRGLD